MNTIFPFSATVLLASSLAAQTPKDQLAKPPSDATAFTILSTAGTNGHADRWSEKDGTQVCRESILLRGMVSELDETLRLDAAGIPFSDTVRGVTPQGDAAETFKVENGVATWKTQVDAGSHPFGESFYSTAARNHVRHGHLPSHASARPREDPPPASRRLRPVRTRTDVLSKVACGGTTWKNRGVGWCFEK